MAITQQLWETEHNHGAGEEFGAMMALIVAEGPCSRNTLSLG